MFNGDNVSVADNQQERLDAEWIVGFVDGEGCFHVSINKMSEMSIGWQVLPEFRVVQHQRDEQILLRLKEYFGFGNVVVNHGDRKEFRVRGKDNLNKLVKFFEKYPLKTSKHKNFELFSKILNLMNNNEHLTMEGLQKIANLASKMNRQVQRHLESSETIRRNPTMLDKI